MTDIPGRHYVKGCNDLEVMFNRQGDNLVVRVNKGPVQVFRVLLVDACKDMSEDELMRFKPVSPDVAFLIGDEGARRARPQGYRQWLRRMLPGQ